MKPEKLKLFSKTRYSLSEEDRVVNALLVILQDSTVSLMHSFFKELGIITSNLQNIEIRDHVSYDLKDIVDGEILIPGILLIALEAKIQKNQFDDNTQVARYFRILSKRSEQRRVLLLLSPDQSEPRIAREIGPQSTACRIIWRSWSDISKWLEGHFEISEDSSDVEEYLVYQYLLYLESLRLIDYISKEIEKGKGYEPKLSCLLGNDTAEKVLLHVYYHNGATGRQIARDHHIALDPVQKQLRRFEKGGVLRKELKGKSLIYYFDERCPYLEEILGMLRKLYDGTPDRLKKRIFNPEQIP